MELTGTTVWFYFVAVCLCVGSAIMPALLAKRRLALATLAAFACLLLIAHLFVVGARLAYFRGKAENRVVGPLLSEVPIIYLSAVSIAVMSAILVKRRPT